MTLSFSCCRFIQELVAHIGVKCARSFPSVLTMWRLAPEVVAVIESDGELELECVIYYNSSSWTRTRPEPPPEERVYETPHCLATLQSYLTMTPASMFALAKQELRPNRGQTFYAHPLIMTVPEPLRALMVPSPEERLVPLPA